MQVTLKDFWDWQSKNHRNPWDHATKWFTYNKKQPLYANSIIRKRYLIDSYFDFLSEWTGKERGEIVSRWEV